MKSVVSYQLAVVSCRGFLLFCLLSFVFYLPACSVPNLEKPECTAARQTVREFYSYHFGNDMKPSKEYLEKRKKYLTENWNFFISKNINDPHDYFTLSDDYPKAFRVGECEVVEPNKTVFQVIFFWKDETRSEQRETKVEMIKENEQWLINRTF